MSISETLKGNIAGIFVEAHSVGFFLIPFDSPMHAERLTLFANELQLVAQSEGIRRGAMLSLAERAMASQYEVWVTVDVASRNALRLEVSTGAEAIRLAHGEPVDVYPSAPVVDVPSKPFLQHPDGG